MGTRALLHVKEGGLQSQTLITIYRQYDGYPSGLAMDIFDALNADKGTTVLNGFGDHTSPEFFNGMGCLAAFLIGKLKTRIGNIYLYPPDSSDCGEEYTYTLYQDEQDLKITWADEYSQVDILVKSIKDWVKKK